ncbi:MAG TPA: hypothetical protein VHX87_05525 [Galbitalea sp.]|jgi:hypothetical protein|nr:hypothetical protein [Galbitalea sp.]
MASDFRAKRNWGAVLIFFLSAGTIVLSLVYDLFPATAWGSIASIVAFLFENFPGPLAIFSGVVIFALGTKRYGMPRLLSVVGNNRFGEAAVFVWGLLALAAQLSFLGIISGDALTIAGAEQVQQVCGIGAFVVGLAAAVFVVRGGVMRGFGRYALFLAVLLSGVTVFLELTTTPALIAIWDLPRLVGLVVLGLAYWRAGTPRDDAAGSNTTDHTDAVPKQPKSLAE